MQNHINIAPLLTHQPLRDLPRTTTLQPLLRPWRLGIFTIVAPIQGTHQLREDRPHEILLRPLPALRQLLHQPAQVAVAAVLHVQVQVRGGLNVLARLVLHDVGVDELLEDGNFGVELGALFVRHAVVGDFFAAEDFVGGFVTDFADDAEGALTW